MPEKSQEKYATSQSRKAEAFERLGVDPEELKKVPHVTHVLRKVKGGISKALEYLRHSDDKAATAFFQVYDSIPAYLAAKLPIEAFCIAAHISPRDISKIIFDQALDQSNQASRLMAATSYPDIVKVSVETAKQPLGIKDRENLGKAVGFIPIPDGMKINIHTNTQASANATAQAASIASLPPAEDTIRRMSNRFNERFIGSATSPVPTLEAHGQDDSLRPPNPREAEYAKRETDQDEEEMEVEAE